MSAISKCEKKVRKYGREVEHKIGRNLTAQIYFPIHWSTNSLHIQHVHISADENKIEDTDSNGVHNNQGLTKDAADAKKTNRSRPHN